MRIINKILLIQSCHTMTTILLPLIFRFRIALNLINFMIMTLVNFFFITFVHYNLCACVLGLL